MDGDADTPRYDVFISYRRSDGSVAARRLRRMLLAYRLPARVRAGRRARLAVFLDTVYERAASDFYDKTIRPALTASRFLIVVATPDAVRRPEGEDWIAREVSDFAATESRDNIIVVRVAGAFADAMPADIAERYPNVQIVDMRDIGWQSRFLPQRAARVADERLKMVGPLFEVPLEEMPRLRREEERQQMGRMGTIAGALTAIVVFTAGISLYSLSTQWEGQQALQQSLQVSQDAIAGITDQFYEDEALDSVSRDLIIANCDLARRLAGMTGAALEDETKVACLIENGVANGVVSDDLGPSRAQIQSALRIGTERYFFEPTEKGGLRTIIHAGYRAWAMLEDQKQGGEGDTPRDGLARFERDYAKEFATRIDDAPDRSIALERLRGAYATAGQLAYDRGQALAEQTGHEATAATHFLQAIDDRKEALATFDDPPPDDIAWYDTAWDLSTATSGYANAIATTDNTLSVQSRHLMDWV